MAPLINRNPWGELPAEPPFVLPNDLETVLAWNGKVKPTQRIRVDLLPDPILGDALGAALIVLALNPSWSEKDAEDHARPDVGVRMRAALATEQPLFWLQDGLEATTGGAWWWAKLRPLIEATSLEAVRDHVAVGHLHQYHSKGSSPGLEPPSGRHNLEVVRKGIARGTPVIALTGASHWRKADPALRQATLHEPNSPQSMVLSSRNFPTAFGLAVSALDAAGR